MNENNEKTYEAENVIVEDCETLPRVEYDLLRDAVSTLKTIRSVLLADKLASYDEMDVIKILLFPEQYLPLKEDTDA